MRRQSAGRVICVWLIVGAFATWLDARGEEALVARLWTYDGARSSMTESRFVVNVGTAAKLTEDHPATNYALLRDERKRADIEAYGRLLARVRNLREPLADGELSIAIGALDKAKSYGDRPEHRGSRALTETTWRLLRSSHDLSSLTHARWKRIAFLIDLIRYKSRWRGPRTRGPSHSPPRRLLGRYSYTTSANMRNDQLLRVLAD
jgi:hypothetical protein